MAYKDKFMQWNNLVSVVILKINIIGERKMKLSKLVGDRFKERPANCLIDSHALMVRGG